MTGCWDPALTIDHYPDLPLYYNNKELINLIWWQAVQRSPLYRLFFPLVFLSINPPCLFCPSPTLPVRALHRSWTSSGPWMAHCYAFSSVGRMSRCHEQPHLWSPRKAGSPHSARGCKLHPANTQTLRAQLSPGSFEHHWKEQNISWFCLNEDRLSGGGGKWPRGARPWPRRRDHAWTAGLWTSYPCVPGVNSLVTAWGQPAMRIHFLANWRTCFDWVPVARWPCGDGRWYPL